MSNRNNQELIKLIGRRLKEDTEFSPARALPIEIERQLDKLRCTEARCCSPYSALHRPGTDTREAASPEEQTVEGD